MPEINKLAFGHKEAYDAVAEEYAHAYYTELAGKPFDRDVLHKLALRLLHKGPVLEIGCGPGQIARYLKDQGLEVRGIDLSPAMVSVAERLNPDIPFKTANMLALPEEDNSLAGIAAFYSIICLPRSEIPAALREFHRALMPGGLLLLSFHGGDGGIHADEWFGKPVSVDVTLFQPAEIEQELREAAFRVEWVRTRPPYDFEYPTTRCYALAEKPQQEEEE
jgi:SAM-dependent methyltransferase